MGIAKISDWFKQYVLLNGIEALRAKELSVEVVNVSKKHGIYTVNLALSLIDTEDRSMMKWGKEQDLHVGDTVTFIQLDHALVESWDGDTVKITLENR